MRRAVGQGIVLCLGVVVAFVGCKGERPEAVVERAAAETVSPGASAQLDDFWRHWSDGKAELSGYELIQPRYGENRVGRAVLVYVTEPYSRSKKVKVDRYDPQNPDHTMALKLNHVRKFQTGIYDYSVMTSVFVEPSRGFEPLEVTFTMQEWCGHVFEEAHFDGGGTVSLNSYFEGESGRSELKVGGDFVAEDTLLITLRDLASERLTRETRSVSMLPSATFRRLHHKPAVASKSTIKWSESPSAVSVPAGEFQVHEATWGRSDGSSCTAQVEVPYPHRIVGWRCSDGEEAKLTGTTRLAYWGTHSEGDEKLMEKMGLDPVSFKAKGG